MGDHWSGLYTKQALSARRAYYTTTAIKDTIDRLTAMIADVQHRPPTYMGLEQKFIIFNEVVPTRVADFFKNEMQYSVVDSTSGQPAGMTLLTRVDWT